MRFPHLSLLLAAAVPFLAGADTVKPVRFGPYMVNHLLFTGNPASYKYALNNVNYRFLVGWIEPISENSKGIFKDAYFETDGDLNVSPFQSDLGTTFNLKPMRYLEFGLSYNRLIYHNSLVAFTAPGVKMIPLEYALPGDLQKLDQEFAGADIFTFQGNITVDMGPTQFFVMASRALWDIDAPGRDFVYEYSNDLVIRPRDRVNSLLLRWGLDLGRYSRSPTFSFTGIAIRNQYWITTQTEQEKNLASIGFTGFRLGRNTVSQTRGLDVNVGYWTMHPQLSSSDWVNSLTFLMEWKWNVQILKL